MLLSDFWCGLLGQTARVRMHAGALKVLVYEHASLASASVQSSQTGTLSAVDFAAADIVLTTYETLQKDFYRQLDPNAMERSLRYPKKYEVSSF